MTVNDLVAAFLAKWGEPRYPTERVEPAHAETTSLRLDSSRANQILSWQPLLDGATAIEWTADWYRRYLQDTDAAARLMGEQLERFESMATGNFSATEAIAPTKFA
jgi:CDP-glucose 4,6-dehydratase